jgi:hypothetical protein
VPFAIITEGGLLSAVSGRAHPAREGRRDTESWTIESSRQRFNRDWEVVSQFKLSKIRVML